MQATAKNGVWTQDILPGIIMTCNDNIGIISVINQYGSNVSYFCPDGIRISDIDQIQNAILRTTKVGEIR